MARAPSPRGCTRSDISPERSEPRKRSQEGCASPSNVAREGRARSDGASPSNVAREGRACRDRKRGGAMNWDPPLVPCAMARAPSPRYQRVNAKLPSTNHHLPTTIYQLPTINYHLPTINYQLPYADAYMRPMRSTDLRASSPGIGYCIPPGSSESAKASKQAMCGA